MKTYIPLTSAELAELWGSYLNDTLAKCVLQYFIQHVEDPEVLSCVDNTLALTEQHIAALKVFFNEADCPVPIGFTEKDVNPNAQKLFSDTFILFYIHQMGMLGINAYSVAVPMASRQDIQGYFAGALAEFTKLYQKTTLILESKGLYIRPPYVPMPLKATFVESSHFLSGWIGKQRPFVVLEVANIFQNMQRNALGKAMLMGFSQVAQSNKVKQYLLRGKEIAGKHTEVFSSQLSSNDLPASMTWDTEVTLSTEPPFSDKLMMFHTTAMITIGLGYYGASTATTMRRDLQAMYSRLIAEIGKYAEDGANLMIENGWMEQPPMVPDRNALANGKE